MAKKRIQVIVPAEERERFRSQARREGMSLSAWMLEAARRRWATTRAEPALESPQDLEAFFARCDARETGTEPDWSEHLAVIERSRAAGRVDP